MPQLLTDYCFLGLLGFLGFGILISLRKPHGREIMVALFKKPIAINSTLVLLFFLSIAALDSLHVPLAPGQTESPTYLDRLLAPLGQSYEKTYSAPLALTLYTQETIFEQGTFQQVYPRLTYPPNYIQTNLQKQAFLFSLVIRSLYLSFLAVGFIWTLVLITQSFYKSRFSLWPRSKALSTLVTLFCCFFLIIASYKVSRYFHVLGTGKIGQDIFYYALKSIRTGLIIGVLTTVFMLPVAVLLGILAGYFGGLLDDIIQYLYTTISSIPSVLLITAAILSFHTYMANHPNYFTSLTSSADVRLFALCFILSMTSWTSLCRLLRAETLKLKTMDFLQAAKTLGSSTPYILRKHLLPNVFPLVLITLVLDFSSLILAEALLSYVGVGVSPLTMSFGNLINSARLELAKEPLVWWPMFAAFLFLFTLVFTSNLLADEVRDTLDPNQANARS